MTTLTYIRAKYNLKANQSQHKLHRSRFGSLTVLFKELGFNRGAEIGIETGRFSKSLLTVNPHLELFAIDTKAELDNAYYNKAKNRLAPFNARIYKETSMNAVKRFADESLDFVYIDAAHDYKNVYNDIKEWSKKVRMGGIIGGHDYMDPNFDGKKDYYKEIYDVKAAVNDWVKANNINPLFVLTKVNCRSWFYVKT